MDAIKQSLEDMAALFNSQMSHFQDELQKAGSPDKITVTSLAADFNSFKSFVVTALNSLQKQLEFLSEESERRELRCRRKFLLVHGVPEVKDEDTTVTAVTHLSKHLIITGLSQDSISRSQRTGRSVTDKSRPLLIKFKDMLIRDKVWKAKSGLKGTGVTLSEFLTKSRHSIFMAARQRFGVSQCWTRDGNIFVIGADDKLHRITSTAELESIPGSMMNDAPKAATKPKSKPKKKK